jgi:hypothetical protein
VPKFLRERPALTDAELAAVATLTRDLEALQGWPVDVEFAIADGELHLLQCRPVTALPDPTPGSLDGAGRPLGGLPAPWQEAGRRDGTGRATGCTSPASSPCSTTTSRAWCTRRASRTAPAPTASPPAHARRFWTHFYSTNRRLELPEAERAVWSARGAAAFAEIDAGLENVWAWRWRPEIEAHLAFWDGFDLRGADDAALLAHLDATYERLVRVWRVHFEIVLPAGRARDAFLTLYRELFEDASELDAAGLLQGQATLTTRAGEALWAVRDAVAAVPGLSEEIVALPASEVLEALAGATTPPPCARPSTPTWPTSGAAPSTWR